jgi:hypothetical protein
LSDEKIENIIIGVLITGVILVVLAIIIALCAVWATDGGMAGRLAGTAVILGIVGIVLSVGSFMAWESV